MPATIRSGSLVPAAAVNDRERRILDERTALLARRRAPAAEPEQRARLVLACRVGPEVYGLDLAATAGVVPARALVPVPGSQAALLGLFGRNGRLIGAYDLGALLGVSPTVVPAAREAKPDVHAAGHLVLLRQDQAAALRVDRALGATTLAVGAGEPGRGRDGLVVDHVRAPPGSLGGEDLLVALLDIDRLLQRLSALSAGA